MILKIGLYCGLGGAIVFCVLGYCAYYWLHQAFAQALEPTEWDIQSGESFKMLANKLGDAKVLAWPMVWYGYGRWYQPGHIQAGNYSLTPSDTPISLLKRFQTGDVIHYSVTLVEGKTFVDWLNRLSETPKLKILFGASEQNSVKETLTLFLQSLQIEHPEGWFFPDTYFFYKGESDVDIMRRAHEKMRQILQQEWASRDPNLPFKTPYEALIMASIIEKETGAAAERAKIAGVFVRRLQKGMLLQTDPTVIYGMGDAFNGNIKRQDLKQATPYNTYVISGLPPTPIAMPSLPALKAALHPAPGDHLYFVAKGDGYHHFSTTLDEHNRAVDQFQRKKTH